METNQELEFLLLQKYMDIYIQLMPYCYKYGGSRLKYLNDLPTFEEFKKDLESFIRPFYKDSFYVFNNEIIKSNCKGIGEKAVFYRYYNYYRGCKYYLDESIQVDLLELEKIKINLL